MKIAVGTNDQKTINPKHFGESRYYIIYEILNGEITSKTIRPNPHQPEGPQHGKTKDIFNLLEDCQLIMGKAMGRKAMDILAAQNLDVIVSHIDEIQEAVEAYLAGEDEKFRFYDPASGKIRPCLERR